MEAKAETMKRLFAYVPSIIGGFNEVFAGHIQHSKTLPIFLVQVFVVNLMRFSDCTEVQIIGSGEPVKSLMNQDIMNQKV